LNKIIKNILGGAVYFLFDKETIVYVGQSVNPLSRIGAHRRDKIFTHYRVMSCQKKRMTYWELLLIQRFQPKYNKAGLKRSPLKQALIDHGSSKKPFIRQTPQTPQVSYSDAFLRVGDSTSTSGGYKFHTQKATHSIFWKEGWSIGYEPQAKPTVVIGESIKIPLDKVKDEPQMRPKTLKKIISERKKERESATVEGHPR
jgi:hypothetical protein